MLCGHVNGNLSYTILRNTQHIVNFMVCTNRMCGQYIDQSFCSVHWVVGAYLLYDSWPIEHARNRSIFMTRLFHHFDFLVLCTQEVNLSYGELDGDAGLAVAGALANKKALKTIELNGKYLYYMHHTLLM